MFDEAALFGALDNRHQHLILLSTEKCNLRCTYCYEDFKVGRMKPEVVAGVKNLLAHRMPGLTHLSISWFGGEPLAASDIVLDVTRYASAEAQARGVDFTASVTTNAVLLTERLFDELSEAGVDRYQISLDGDREEHNRTRVKRDGSGTYDRIMGHLRHMKSTDHRFEVTLRVHFTVDGRKDVSSLLPVLQQELLDDPRFKVHFKCIEDFSGALAGQKVYVDRDREHEIIAELSSRLGKRNLSNFPETICYASRPNSLLVRPDGRLAKCTISFQNDRHSIGRLLPDGSLEIDDARLAPWVRGFATGDAETLKCPLNGYAI